MPTLSALGKIQQGILRNQSTRGFFGFEFFFFKTVFGMFLAHPVCVKSVKYKMSRSFKVLSQGIL
jgi:hypothetical protein